ncbi:MAG: ribonuclease HII [Candidatus Omnitrophota bacterium]|nr:MAG: ribonuclease HII [Candidatus Omnitrophota bacterium]
MIVGVDEAGRGPLAGSVVACALHLKNPALFVAKDSKALSERARQHIYEKLTEHSIYAVDIATAQEIDKFNILEATFLACNRAIENLFKKAPQLKKAKFIIDGTLFRTEHRIKYECVPKADKKIKEVACASVMAKVVRDYLMGVADSLYPEWSFSQHKGYPTKKHFSLIKKHSLTPLHRLSFSPCKDRKR